MTKEMKHRLRWSCLAFALLLCCLAVSCKGEGDAFVDPSADPATEAPIEAPTEEKSTEEAPKGPATYSILDAYDSLKLHGRTYLMPRGLACDFTASGIEFSVCAEGAVEMNVVVDRDTYFTVWIDGVRQEGRLKAGVGAGRLTLATLSEDAPHIIRVLKQTEAQFAVCEIRSLCFKGEFGEKPAEAELSIEFIGDSIVCGHGNLCINGEAGEGTALYEDGTLAFPYLTAESLKADCTVVGCSGVGLEKGFTSFKATDFYPVASYYRDRGVMQTFEKRPDLVVINLGTNDQTKKSSKEGVIEGVKNLIAMVREKYGNVKIVWTNNMMGETTVIPWVTEAIESLGGESAGIWICELNRDRAGGNGHPTEEGHFIAARMLTRFLKEKGIVSVVG